MKFKERDFIVHKDGTEMIYRVVTPVGSDKLKEVYFGVWLTRRTKPHIVMEKEYISIKKQDLKNWKVTDEVKQ